MKTTFFQKLKNFIHNHKIISTIIALMIMYIGYKYTFGKSTSSATLYSIGEVTKGTIISTVTGTGQVSASGQIDIKSQVTGTVLSVAKVDGTTVPAGTLLAHIDATDAYNALQSAQIAYAKLVKPADSSDIATNKVAVDTSYANGLGAISQVFLSYPAIVTGLNDLFYTKAGFLSDQNMISQPATARNFAGKAAAQFDRANKEYLNALSSYNTITHNSNTQTIDTLLSDTAFMLKDMAEALKDTQNTLTYLSQQSSYNISAGNTATTNVNSWLSTTNSSISSIANAQSSISNAVNALRKLTDGADTLDIQSQQLNLDLKQQAYNNAFIRAPFDGVFAKSNINVGDSINSGTSIGTFISNKDIATITLNEVDVAKVKIGQKVTLTFDAIPDLTISGTVAEIDLVGTVSQGVVSYNVKISFDTQDDRVLSGMSVNASIATVVRQDVLSVPTSAVKSQNGNSYVLVVPNTTAVTNGTGISLTTARVNTPVTIGISDDTNTEILTGLSEREKVVTKTTGGTATKTTATPSIFGAATSRPNTGTARAVAR